MINPASLMKVIGMRNKFINNHPKVAEFFRRVVVNGMPEGTIIEVTVTKPGEDPITTNMKVLASDLEIMNELKNLK